MNENEQFTISQIASMAEVNVETIRYYQRIRLIPTPLKPKQGYRKYSISAVKQIRFIKRAQQLGFSLDEIAELLSMEHGRCVDVRKKAEIKRQQIQEQIKDLMTLEKTLSTLISSCHTDSVTNNDSQRCCPIIESLLQK